MVEIEVTITLKSPLNIGSGAQQGTLAQRGLLKDQHGWPYIPATLLKGRMRHAAEQVASTLNTATPVLDPHEYRVRRPTDPISILFGTPWMPGIALFEDCYLTGPEPIMAFKAENSHPRTTERTGVSINRRRRVAADQRLYNTELLWPGAALEFSGTIRGELNQAQAGLLVAALRLIPALGRSKSAGLGWFRSSTTVRADNDVWTPALMLAALKGGI